MLRCYRAQNWDGARAALAECVGSPVNLAEFYQLYAKRVAFFEGNPPGPDWDGVFVSETK